jgi:hypothetical protein
MMDINFARAVEMQLQLLWQGGPAFVQKMK